jgi:hypothetical protein
MKLTQYFVLAIAALVLVTAGCIRSEITSEISIDGQWEFAKSTESDGETDIPLVHELAAFPPSIKITEDGEVTMLWYETTIRGDLVKVNSTDYRITNQIAFGEGSTWNLRDAFLKYYPEEGLLRYIHHNPYSEEDTYFFFTRD